MTPTYSLLARVTLLLLAVMLAACGQVDANASPWSGDSATAARDSELVALRAIVWQRDRAVTDVRELSELVAQIDSEVARAEDQLAITPTVVVCEDDVECAQSRFNQLRTQVRSLVDRLALTQTRLRAAARAQATTAASDSLLRAQATQLQASVNSLADAATRQVEVLDSLRTRVDQLKEDSTLVATLKARVASAEAADDSVFMIAATKAELLKAGVVQERGGMFLLGFGKTLVPVANPPAKGWKVLSKKRDSVIVLEPGDKWFTVVSPHSVSLLRADRSNKDRRSGTVRISAPAQFWSTSRYLILLQH